MSKKDQEVYVGNITPWTGWCAIEYCQLCKKGPLGVTFEFEYSIGKEECVYVREGCLTCTKSLVTQDKEYSSRDFWQKAVDNGKNTYLLFLEHGLIDDFHL